MKIRTGFVSNSSSSSFLICSKNKDDEFIKRRLAELLQFNKASPGRVFTDEDEVNFLSQVMADEYLAPHGEAELERYYSWDEYPSDGASAAIEALFKEGFIVFEGEMPDYGMGGSTMQAFLRWIDYCRIEDDFGFIQCDGGSDPDIAKALKERKKRDAPD
jgi:hypothetical protein